MALKIASSGTTNIVLIATAIFDGDFKLFSALDMCYVICVLAMGSGLL